MKLAFTATLTGMATILASPVSAQTRSTRETATTYGARLTAKGTIADLNQNRINNRIDSRIGNRLSLRIERYRTGATDNPVAGFGNTQDDKTRIAPVSGLQPSANDPQ